MSTLKHYLENYFDQLPNKESSSLDNCASKLERLIETPLLYFKDGYLESLRERTTALRMFPMLAAQINALIDSLEFNDDTDFYALTNTFEEQLKDMCRVEVQKEQLSYLEDTMKGRNGTVPPWENNQQQ
ncbi:hypothetical protein SAMD00019534_055940 [Acytostelium subglobosum LB1]|uniref:hypothetical protein n=1 Tax=Acytostelium subglobosum LB1 TaxID=1410327 RepID=UPI000644E11D|nr:hypothetical protein SAMD00019534_055940 [Acytostelium subglobosum LB1]GAM22419.1 hypothetical protein SAMD00019534_055940 [Acytostelium subglobosum LB1]|eukprot:XP_012754539.1 hypothetical protein SAMD00019534_055940 [Acytostelium subglobosum LB1]